MNEPLSTTVLITDMEGSTEFTEGRGDDAAMDLLRVHERIVRDIVAGHRGREIKSMGDGFMIAFPTPDVGIACALDIQEALARHNSDHPEQVIRVRMGINAGTVIEEGGDIYGTTVNAASRIAAKARSGQVLVSEAVRNESHRTGDWACVDRGPFWLKGLRQRWTLYEVTRGPELAVAQEPERFTPFLDREDERATLRLYVDAALEGRGGMVLLSGDAGVGKTRIAEEIGLEASGRGMRFLTGRCYEASQAHAFAPFVDVLEAVERAVSPHTFRSILGEAAGEIARLAPHIRRQYADIPEPVTLPDPDQARRYLQTSVRNVLAGIAHERPLFVLLDDLHWSDEPSLRLLEQLAADLLTLPILIVGTYIRAGLTESGVLGATIETLHRRRLVEHIHVGPLSQDDLGALLEALGGKDPPPGLVQLLYRETDGNVFFAEEVARDLLRQGKILDETGRWRPDVESLDLDVPDSVRLTIGRRLDGLTATTRRMLAIAAVIGRAFGFELLITVSELEEEELIDALEEAERSRIIASTSEGGAIQFRFTHELIRQTLVGDVSLTRRQIWHQRIAEAMQDEFSSTLADHAAEIAYHLSEAGRRADPSTTARFLVAAGERALEASAYEEAHRHLDRALSLLPYDDLAIRAPILEKLALAECSLGHLDEALITWREALDAYDAAKDVDAIGRLCLDAGLLASFWRAGEGYKLAKRGLEAIGDRRNPVRGGLLAICAGFEGAVGRYEDAEHLFDEALTHAGEDHRVLGTTLYMRAYNYLLHLEHAKVVEVGREAMSHLRQASDVWTLASASAHVGSALAWLGHFEEGASVAEEGKKLGRKLGNWTAYYAADRARSFRHLGRNPDLGRLEADGLRDYETGRSLGVDWLTSTGAGRVGLAAFWAGRWQQALERYEEATHLDPPGAGGGHAPRLFLCHAYMGNRSLATDLIEQARPGFARAGRANPGPAWISALMGIEALAILGESEAAADLYPVALDIMSKGSVLRAWDFRLLQTLAGIAATCAGDWSTAEHHFREALRLAHDLPMRLEEPEARRFYAQMLLLRAGPGDRDEAWRELEQAIAEYRAIGMPAHEELARRLLTA